MRWEAHLPAARRDDLPGLAGRLLSSSYTPGPGDPRHEPMLAALERLFRGHAEGGTVRFLYETELWWGRP